MTGAGKRKAKGGRRRNGASNQQESFSDLFSLNSHEVEAWQQFSETSPFGHGEPSRQAESKRLEDEGIWSVAGGGARPVYSKLPRQHPEAPTFDLHTSQRDRTFDSYAKAMNLRQQETQLAQLTENQNSSTARRQSISSQGSDAEVVVFAGRGKTQYPDTRTHTRSKAVNKDAIMEDYIQNMKENAVDDTRVGGYDGSKELEHKAESDEKQADDEWGSVELQDLDYLSTSSEVLENTIRVLGKRSRGSRDQYLVVRKNEPTDFARWVSRDQIRVPDAAEVISQFEEKQQEKQKFESNSEEEDPSDATLSENEYSTIDGSDSEADDEDLRERRELRISDEQIARLLTKQAELGIDGDELLLFNGEGIEPESDLEDLPQPSSFLRKQTRKTSGRLDRTKESRKSSDFLPQLVAESYGDFDVMDRERPSIRGKPKKGSKPEDFLALSDPELLQDLKASWEKDRKKKKIKKKEREELRSQGLLGRNGKQDLRAKYRGGLTMDELKEEIKMFLAAPMTQSLPLPPMNNWERKMVHEVALKLSLKSKSRGQGSNRFPVLYKTSRSMTLTEAKEALVDNMFSPKRFLPKPRKGATAVKSSRGAGVNGAASYRDGEVVGVGAPELGKDNRGRAMLEKMGWSNGTALGALANNGGIIQPVAQIVKTTRAGLG